jgi:hypothetical protein
MYTKWASGPKLRVTAFAGMVMRPAPPGDPRILKITVQNVGTGPTTITNVVFEIYPSRWARFRRRPSDPSAVLNTYQGPQLPHKLDIGGQFVAVMEEDQEFNKWLLSSGNVWCAVVHTVAKKPVLAKIIDLKK